MEYSGIDLHCHSTVSDGVLTPTQLAQRAYENGATLWSLTDHDEVGGQAEARQAALALGMNYITGIEISVTWLNKTVHIVGLHFDPENMALRNGLQKIRDDRVSRAHVMAARLEDFGVKNAFEGALALAGNPDLLSRTHFARYMVEQGHCKHMQEVFDRYLGDGKPAYIPGAWATLLEAVTWITEAGGTAVIAHPGRYKYSSSEFSTLFHSFKLMGGTAIEVVTGSHKPEQYHQYANVAKHYGFFASCGSDFHGPNESKMDVGKVPELPLGLTPVWEQWLDD
ncbi:phosphoesterase [Pelistega indica]|uniref:Phosphoesterase n=1 Tax=Pelistega indica TaxID=1414851 RepID=V8G7R5_9BURK|nr:3',5'-nucleoside bisphosphate phosphatase [Pelistega indica]ETD72574.1 phosphoesterase [Pelistega indica]